MRTNLGEGEKILGDRNDILHLLDGLDTVLDSLSVLSTRTVEDVLDLLDVTLSPVTVRLPDALHHTSN